MGLGSGLQKAGIPLYGFALCLLFALTGCVTTETEVFESSPDEALEARVQLARSYIGEQNWEDAKRNLKLAQDIDPRSPDVYEAFALVYQSTGEYELAEDSFKRAISLRNPFSRARNNYAAFLYSQARYQEAAEQLEVVVQDTLYKGRPRAFVNLGLARVDTVARVLPLAIAGVGDGVSLPLWPHRIEPRRLFRRHDQRQPYPDEHQRKLLRYVH